MKTQQLIRKTKQQTMIDEQEHCLKLTMTSDASQWYTVLTASIYTVVLG